MLFQSLDLSAPVAITLTANGTYTEPNGCGYSPVTVNVQSISEAKAVVHVTHDSGYVCTATNGAAILSSDAGLTWMFCLPSAGSWTFSCNGYSETISVSEYEFKTLFVGLRYYIYQSGVGATMNLYKYAQSNATISYDSAKISATIKNNLHQQSCIRTSSAVDVTGYNELSFDIECSALGYEESYRARFICSSEAFTVDNFDQEIAERMVVNSSRHIKVMDISSMTGEMYIGISGGWAGNVYNIYLE